MINCCFSIGLAALPEYIDILTTFCNLETQQESISPVVPNQKDLETPSPSLILPVHLSICLPGSSVLLLAISCQLIAGYISWYMVDFINTVSGFRVWSNIFKHMVTPQTPQSSGQNGYGPKTLKLQTKVNKQTKQKNFSQISWLSKVFCYTAES